MPANKGLCFVIPMKDPRDSKQRLREILASEERQTLAMTLFSQTLKFLGTHFPNIDVLVVTPSQQIIDVSLSCGAQALLEDASGGLNGALTKAAIWCRQHHYSSQLILPADIVNLDEQELRQLIDNTADAPCVTICPASDGGTNALLTSPADIIAFSYGFNSSHNHAAAARAQGITPQVLELEKLAFDLDTPSDYATACNSHSSAPLIQTIDIEHSSRKLRRSAV